MRIINSDRKEDIIPKMQQILHYVDPCNELFAPEDLKGVETILTEWEKAKAPLRQAFGGCIVEVGEVSLHLFENEKLTLIQHFIKSLQNDWCNTFPDFCEYEEEGYELGNYLANNNSLEVFENKSDVDWEAPDGIIISSGTKISKNFKHFFANEDLVRAVQDKFSTVIQQDKISGTLCLSIHPLDFLSSSENNYKWRSCHALNGEFAGGNLSYMMDRCTFMWYLKGADDVKLPRFPQSVPWNDKKWRMLTFMDEAHRILWAGRQYPFFSDEILEICLAVINELIDGLFPQWEHKYIHSIIDPITNEEVRLCDDYILYKGLMLTRNQLISDAKGSRHYNDLLHSTLYIPYYSIDKYGYWNSDDLPIIKVGHKHVCAYCGSESHPQESSIFICNKCDAKLHPPHCDCCGKPIYETEPRFWVQELGFICADCEDKFTVECPNCHRRHYKEKNCEFCSTISFGSDPDLFNSLKEAIGQITTSDINVENIIDTSFYVLQNQQYERR